MGHATAVPTVGVLEGIVVNDNSSVAPPPGAKAVLGAPTGSVLFLIELIAYKEYFFSICKIKKLSV